ncbi:MAG: 30S ribosomal protein S3 [Patescibacteria group bacterium]
MGQKTHPRGFRLGTTSDWKSQWFSERDKDYVENVVEDKKIREFIRDNISQAGIKEIRIERFLNNLKITVFVSRPGMAIGRGGSRIELLRDGLEKICDVRPELVIEQVRKPYLSAELVAQEVAQQLERRRRASRVMEFQAQRVMDSGAEGVRIQLSGRLGGSEYSRVDKVSKGSVPLQTIRADIDYAENDVRTKFGTIGIKVWIYLEEEEI